MAAPLVIDYPPDAPAPVAKPGRGAKVKPAKPDTPVRPRVVAPARVEADHDTNGARALVKVCEAISRKTGWRPYESFRRTVEIANQAMTARGVPGPAEDEYLRLIAGLDRAVLDLMAEFAGTLWLTAWPDGFSLDQPPDFRDHLGTAYMAITQSDKFHGQYFTPWNVASMMARMLCGADEALARTPEDPLKVCDPACGSGVMLLAYAAALPWRAVQEGRVAFYGMDIDPCCAHMARLNLWCRGLGGRWPAPVLILRDLAFIDRELAASARANAPHGHVPPETIAAESCPDYAAVARALGRLDGSHRDPAAAPPAPRVGKVKPNRRQ